MSYTRNLARYDEMRTEELDPARPSAAPVRHEGGNPVRERTAGL